MRPNSLAFRLTVSAAAIAVVLLLIAAIVLNGLFQQALQRNFDQRLQAVLDGLQANVELKPDGVPVITGTLADDRFKVADSGWYWQVTPTTPGVTGLVSESQLKTKLAPSTENLATRNKERSIY